MDSEYRKGQKSVAMGAGVVMFAVGTWTVTHYPDLGIPLLIGGYLAVTWGGSDGDNRVGQ